MKTKIIHLLACLGMLGFSFTSAEKVEAQCCISLLPPTNTATVTITAPWGNSGDFSAADNPAVFIDQVTVGNGAVPAGSYNGWCIDVPNNIGNGPTSYDTTMYSTCDTNVNNELPAGYPSTVYIDPAAWHAVNYLLNHKNGAYFWDLQNAIWFFIGGPVPPALGPPVFPPTDSNAVNILINDALNNAPSWQSQCGDVMGVIVSISVSPGAPLEQLTLIEVPCCAISFTKCPGDLTLGCNPAPSSIPDCQGTVDTNIVNAVSCCGRPVTITCSKSESTVNCTTFRLLTYTATDGLGNTATCSRNIIWTTDTNAPVFTMVPTNSILGCNPSTLPTDSSVQAKVVAMDGCSGSPTITVTHVDGGTPPCVMTRTFTITATDTCKNKAITMVTYTWTIDTTPPVIVSIPGSTNYGCNPAVLPSDASVKALVMAMDTCSSATINVSHVDGGSPCAMTRTFSIFATDACSNISPVTNVTYFWKVDTTPPMIKCPPDYFVSNGMTSITCYDQNGWGSSSGNACNALSNCFNKIYSNGYIECGVSGYGGHSVKCYGARCVQWLLPCGGTPGCLNTDYINPTSCNGGAFPGQVLCLQLNVDCGDNHDVSGFNGCFGNLVLNDPTCPLNGKSCRQILGICQTALGGGDVSKYGCSLSQLCDLCSNLNCSFSNCVPSAWCKGHVGGVVTSNVPPSQSGYATATDNCGGSPTITYSDVVTSGGCNGTFTIVRTWKATDSCGLSSTCTQNIFIGNPNGNVCGYVFMDCNGDGFLTPGIDVGMSNIVVTLKGANGVVIGTTTTDNNGSYCFYNLAAGTYMVCVAGPSNNVQTAGCHVNHWLDSNGNDCWNENDGYQHWKGLNGVDCWNANDGCQHYKNSSGQDCWKDRYGYTHTQNCTYTSCNVPKNNCETFTLGPCEAKTSVNFSYHGVLPKCSVSVSGPTKGICGRTSSYTCTVVNTGTTCLTTCNVNACGNNYPCPSLSPGQSCTFQINYCYKTSDYGNFSCQATASCNYNGSNYPCTAKGSCNTTVSYW